jgi:hypothetical protein
MLLYGPVFQTCVNLYGLQLQTCVNSVNLYVVFPTYVNLFAEFQTNVK